LQVEVGYRASFFKKKKKRKGRLAHLLLPQKMLRYAPQERISAKEALKHPYFDDLDKTKYP
jgi:serine/threonine protein kinase